MLNQHHIGPVPFKIYYFYEVFSSIGLKNIIIAQEEPNICLDANKKNNRCLSRVPSFVMPVFFLNFDMFSYKLNKTGRMQAGLT